MVMRPDPKVLAEQTRPATSVRFEPLAKSQIRPDTWVVVSLRTDGDVSIAQLVTAMADGRPIHYYLKNAIQIAPEKLFDMRALINEAIDALFVPEEEAAQIT